MRVGRHKVEGDPPFENGDRNYPYPPLLDEHAALKESPTLYSNA